MINQLSYLGGPTLYDTCDYCDYHYHYSSHYLSHCFCSYCIMYYLLLPIGSMYGIYANIWGILMVNVTIYGIHGSYGLLLASFLSFLGRSPLSRNAGFPLLSSARGSAWTWAKTSLAPFNTPFPPWRPRALGRIGIYWDLPKNGTGTPVGRCWKMLGNMRTQRLDGVVI